MKGFFLLELIVVMAIIGIFASITIFSITEFQKFFLTRSVDNELKTILDRTRNLAIADYQDSGWSFRIENNQAMIYKGNNFVARDISYDEKYDLPAKITATTTSDIYFKPLNGELNTSATTTIDYNGSTTDIFISTNGFIK